jgi:uncharacterized MAPEG superfamily protein
MHLANDPILSLYALVATLVSLHLVALALYTGRVRALHKVFVNTEDAAAFKGKETEAEHPDVLRVKRAHMNALESAVPFLAVGLLYALSGPSKVGAQAYFFTYLGARVLHTVFYLAQKQPFRTLTFAIGALAIIGMGVHVIRTVI